MKPTHDWKEQLKKWMENQKSINENNTPNHTQRINALQGVLSTALDHVLADSYLDRPNVLRDIITAYLDVGQDIHDLAFRFPNLSDDRLFDRLYGLGLHLENRGLENVALNPNYATLAKFGVGIQAAVRARRKPERMAEDTRREARRVIRAQKSEDDLSARIVDSFLEEVDAIDHPWLGQAVDAWEIDNDRRKLNATYLDSRDLRQQERKVCQTADRVIAAVRSVVTPSGDIKGLLNLESEGLYCWQTHQARVSHAEDLVEPIQAVRTPIVDKGRVLALIS